VRPSGADAKTDAGEEFRPLELVLESESLGHGKRLPRSAKQHLAGPVEPQPATVKYQEAVESALVESPAGSFARSADNPMRADHARLGRARHHSCRGGKGK
jgi:hypothetical protein